MAMINDRDLMRLEPSLFCDGISAATLLIETDDASVSGSSLTSSGSDFVKMDIDAGHVALVADEVGEVVARISATELTASLPRATPDDPVISLTPGTGLALKVPTFIRHIDYAQAWVLGALGLDAADPVCSLDGSAILNPADVARLIALETVARAFRAAAAQNPSDQALAARASLYAEDVIAARHRTGAVLDLDGDGVADATRRIDVIALQRC